MAITTTRVYFRSSHFLIYLNHDINLYFRLFADIIVDNPTTAAATLNSDLKKILNANGKNI
jgi:hypothetical protein